MKTFLTAFAMFGFLICFRLMPAAAQEGQKIEEGKIILEKWITAQGGRDRLQSIRDVKFSATVKVIPIGIAGTSITYQKRPNKQRTEIKLTRMTVIQCSNGETGWISNLTGSFQDMPKEAHEQFKKAALASDMLLNPVKYGITPSFEGLKSVEGKDYIVLKLSSSDDRSTDHYIDPDTYLEYKSVTISPNGEEETFLSDYREIEGTRVPFSTKIHQGGKEFMTFSVTEYKYNTNLEDSIFEKPKDVVRRRPQVPTKPYPYREEEVIYENKTAGINLAATLTIPNGKGPFPAVVLITGSGRQDRDESVIDIDHKPFLVLADYLTRKGIIVLRTDDRGVGTSEGDFDAATAADFATDAEAGLAFLKNRPQVDSRKIGLLGHSTGGMVAPMAAAHNPSAAFVVMMAGVGLPGGELIVEQARILAEARGMSREEVEKMAATNHEMLAIIKREKNKAALEMELRKKLSGMVSEQLIKQADSPFFRHLIEYDPATALRKVRCPVLAINGDKDVQVPCRQNLQAIRAALEAGGNRNFEIMELPGLNHLFQNAKTGLPTEYGDIQETMSPVALEKIASWILKQPQF
ncbi:MAG: hypothetical protein H6Q04_3255 [Acidobacteria bacterium]|nr:hypothetical protein [Acidobacteriota bacterium]